MTLRFAPPPHLEGPTPGGSGLIRRTLMRVIEHGAAEQILTRLAQRRSPLLGEAAREDLSDAAREAAERVAAERFPTVSVEHLVHIIDLAFATSTKVEEGRAASFSLSLVPREQIGHRRRWTQVLRDPIALDAEVLRKVAPAADVWTTCLLVDEGPHGRPEIWGVWSIPAEVDPNDWVVPTEIVVRATAPATVHVALCGERVWSLERGEPVEAPATDRSVHALFRALGADHRDSRPNALWAIVREVERRGNGGTLAICAQGEGDWFSGHRVTTAGPTIERLAHLARKRRRFEAIGEGHRCPTVPFAPGCPNIDALIEHGRFRTAARAIAGFANVDGAVILRLEDLRVEAFAARLSATAPCDDVFVTGSTGVPAHSIPIGRVGGMRHQSAAHWVAGAPGSRLAIVISTDGMVSLFCGRKGGGVAAFRPLTHGIDRDLA